MACATSGMAPLPSPRIRSMRNITTGKVKEMAASASVPSLETNHAFVRWYMVMANVPASIGMAIPIIVFGMLFSTSFDTLLFCCI